MAWDTGTITASGPHTVLSQKIKDLCGDTGVVNWSFVENIPAGTGAGQSGSASYSVDVFKCSGSGTDANSAATDWYLGFYIPGTDGAVSGNTLVAEGYLSIADNPAHADRGKFKRPCSQGSTSVTTVPTGTGYWISDTYATFATYSAEFGATPTLNTSGFTYYIKMTNNLIIVSTMVGAGEGHFAAMLLDSLTSVSDPCPLIAFTSVTSPGPTRLPSVVTASVTDMWEVIFAHWTGNINAIGTTTNAANRNDFWQGNKIHVSRILAASRASSLSWYQVGGMRGLVKADILAFSTGGTTNLGDTMVIDGNTWTVIANGNLGGFSTVAIVRAN